MDRSIVHPNFAKPLDKKKSTAQISSSKLPTSGATSTATTTTSHAGSNGSISSASAIQYDHETYLELVAGRTSPVEKTASQLYKEERARKLSLRAQDPAVLTGPLDLDIDTYGDSSRYRYDYVDGYRKGDSSKK